MGKKEVTLILGGTADYAFALGNVLIGLERHSPGFVDEVFIYHNGLSSHDRQCLQKIRQCTFVDYHPERLLDLDKGKVGRFSYMAFARYHLFDHLATSRFVLYLDADVVIRKDIRDIIRYIPVGLREGFSLNESLGPNQYGFPASVKGYNSGVIIAHECLPHAGLTEQCYDLTVTHWDTLRFPDQGIINLVLHLNGIPVCSLPTAYNAPLHSLPYSHRIIHQTNTKKYWLNGVASLLVPEWGEYNEQWRALGGTPYRKSKYLWEFASFRNRRTFDSMEFMAQVYKHAVDSFLDSLRNLLASSGLSGVVRKSYTIYIAIPGDEEVRFEILIWGNQAVVSFWTTRREFYARLAGYVEKTQKDTHEDFVCASASDGCRIRKLMTMDVAFLCSGQGTALCIGALRTLALLALQDTPEQSDLLHGILAIACDEEKADVE